MQGPAGKCDSHGAVHESTYLSDVQGERRYFAETSDVSLTDCLSPQTLLPKKIPRPYRLRYRSKEFSTTFFGSV